MSDSGRVNHFSRLILICIALVALCLPAGAQPEYDDSVWTPRTKCYFGMPYSGHAVMRGGKGHMVDLLKDAFAPTKIDLEHVPLPYDRAIEGVEKGSIHCTLDVEGRHKKLESKAVVAVYDLSVAYLREGGFKDIKEMAGKRIAFVHGFGITEYLPVKVKTLLVYDLSSGFHMLERGHVSYVLGENRLLKEAMFDSKIPPGIFEVKKLKAFNLKVIFTPSEEGRRFRDVFDLRMKEMIKSGELREIEEEYGSSKEIIQRLIDVNKNL